MKKALPRLDFEVFLTNRCNLACTYCSSRHLRGERRTRKLDFEQVKRFVDLVSSDKRFGGTIKLLFSGGEPLLEFGLLRRAVDYIRSRPREFKLSVMTNATLLTPARLDYLVRNKVNVGISLDGFRRVNDLHRKFAAGGGSVFSSVLRGLGPGFPAERHLSRCRLMSTLTPRTIGGLPGVVDFLRHGVGTRKISVELEAYEDWNRADEERWRAALRRLIAGFLGALRPGADPARAEAAFAEFPFLQNKHFLDDAEDNKNAVALTLLYDGRFYTSSDLAAGPGAGKARYAVGDLERGIDLRRAGKISGRVAAAVAKGCRFMDGPRSPYEGYAWGLANGFSAKRLKRVLDCTSRLNRIFWEESGPYLALFRRYKPVYTAPGFGDFTHKPRYAADKPVRRFTLRAGAGSDPARLREALDYFLYAPGRRKELLLRPDAPAAGALLDGLLVYALAKAKYLGKALRVSLVGREAR